MEGDQNRRRLDRTHGRAQPVRVGPADEQRAQRATASDHARTHEPRRTIAAVIATLIGGGLTCLGLSALLSDTELTPESAQVNLQPTDAAQLGPVHPAALDTPPPAKLVARPTARRIPSRPRHALSTLVAPHEWPPETPSPTQVDDSRFLEALVALCGPHADDAVRPWYGPWVLQSARRHAADPFMLGALLFVTSECADRQHPEGMLQLDVAMYTGGLHARTYRYAAFVDGAWIERDMPLDAFPLTEDFARSTQSAIYFAAAFLRVWEDQSPGLRSIFVQPAEFRSYVSHYFWGDTVGSNREEDAVLVARRRLLEYYGAKAPSPAVRWRGFELGCPLDGCPRIVTSTLGDARDGGKRLHAGNDFESYRGEPVRAVADGQVVFAGVDWPGVGAASKIPIWAQRNVDASEMGAGGLYICIDHGERQREQLLSCYMHLESAMVAQGRWVARGDQIGRVGTTGIRQSRPHLHFELHSNGGAHRATDLMTPLALGRPTAQAAQHDARTRHKLAAGMGGTEQAAAP